LHYLLTYLLTYLSMKHNITISLDHEIVSKLKQENNYSDVINEQMKAFYEEESIENIQILKEKLVKTKQIIKESNKKRRDIEKHMEKLRIKEKRILNLKFTRKQMIQEIIARRKIEARSYKRVEYFDTPEDEANRILKGGD